MKNLKVILTLGILLMVLFTACESEDDSGPGENEIYMENSEYVPQNKIVEVGTTVKWINKDPFAHTVTSPVGLFESGTIESGGTFEYTFNNTGTFEVICTIHPNMTGTVTVENSGSK